MPTHLLSSNIDKQLRDSTNENVSTTASLEISGLVSGRPPPELGRPRNRLRCRCQWRRGRLGEGARVLVIPPSPRPGHSSSSKQAMGAATARQLHPGRAREAKTLAIGRVRKGHAYSPAHVRSDRPAADARRSHGLSFGPTHGRLRPACGTAPFLAPLWRADGQPLVERGALRRRRRTRSATIPRAFIRMPGAIATGSSTRSIATCLTTNSSNSNWPPTK